MTSPAETGPDLPSDAQALLDAVVAISSDLDLHSVLDRIVVSACRITGARYGALGVLDNSGDHLVEFVTSGLTPEERAAIGDLPRGKGILGLLIEEPHPLRLPDPAGPPRVVRLPGPPPADGDVPRCAGAGPGDGVRQPLPDREGGRGGLHRADGSWSTRSRGRPGS